MVAKLQVALLEAVECKRQRHEHVGDRVDHHGDARSRTRGKWEKSSVRAMEDCMT
jgi:hypothetical protein